MSEEKKTALDIVREESRNLALPDLKPGVGLQQVFGRGSLGEITSFGGKSLMQNAERVDAAFEKSYDLQRVFSRNHSEWTRRHVNLDYYDPWHNMRQISAELSSRRNALQEAKWRHVKNEIKVKEYKKRMDLLADDDELEKLKLQVKIAELQEGMVSGMAHIEGAMKDVLALEDLYEQLKKQISDFNEADYEHMNARAHLRQAISQSLRDIRQYGSITKGEQELLEQIGVNPGKVQELLRKYVEDERVAEDYSVSGLKDFIERLSDELLPVAKIKSELFGFDSDPKTDYMYLERIGELSLLEDHSNNERADEETK